MRFLALAYACEPGEGSEPGVGWTWARMLARHADTWVITRANNRVAIEVGLPSIPEAPRLHFVYVDLPHWMRFWKRGQRGLRPYYVLWLLAALRRARALHRAQGFDLVWHVTLANLWLGTVGGLIGPPFVWGPVGGAVSAPPRLMAAMGLKGMLYEAVRYAARQTGRYLNPLARLGWRTSTLILTMNHETKGWLPARFRHRARILCNVALDGLPPPAEEGEPGPKVAMFAGRLLAWKGVWLALLAIASLPGWRLLVCGSGPEEGRLREMASALRIADRVEFMGRVPRPEVLRLMREEASVFLFPSTHEECGWAVGEALASGLPVVCLDRGGPPVLTDGAGAVVSSRGRAAEVASRLATSLTEVHGTPPRLYVERGTRLSLDAMTSSLGTLIREARSRE